MSGRVPCAQPVPAVARDTLDQLVTKLRALVLSTGTHKPPADNGAVVCARARSPVRAAVDGLCRAYCAQHARTASAAHIVQTCLASCALQHATSAVLEDCANCRRKALEVSFRDTHSHSPTLSPSHSPFFFSFLFLFRVRSHSHRTALPSRSSTQRRAAHHSAQ